MKEFNFEKLDVYRKAEDLASQIYGLTKEFPKEEAFGITSQLRRAAVSIALNIAEGSARPKKDFSRFVDMARGSVLECVAIVQISLKQKYIKEETVERLRTQLEEISKMLSGLKSSLNRGANTYHRNTTNNELKTMN